MYVDLWVLFLLAVRNVEYGIEIVPAHAWCDVKCCDYHIMRQLYSLTVILRLAEITVHASR